ncbi:MAG: type II toxin-antitoxin system prevent-host-death family antitoxin [Actinomycetota bacterium]|jgi:prevent-host-death family protein|nr:type II toxin-antitoxin system prevent-host-death family antitoxin [Rubrobacter sp.]MDQ3508692.1 type II toxin-antitoxin system prevent-host-death family antitoxin [Actinomycetota bacterium]
MAAEHEKVGVRELRQNLSVYLRRVAEGETLEVTERGRPVAVISPLPEESTPLKRLVSSGRAVRPNGDLLDLPDAPEGGSLGAALHEARSDRL